MAGKPHVTLHNIVTHNIDMVNKLKLLEDNADRENQEHDILRQGDLSLRVIKDIKSGRNKKKLSKEDVVLPTRSQLKRSKVTSKSKHK